MANLRSCGVRWARECKSKIGKQKEDHKSISIDSYPVPFHSKNLSLMILLQHQIEDLTELNFQGESPNNLTSKGNS